MKAMSLLIKPVSGNCNMRCRYCFYTDVSEMREVKSYGMMSLHTLETIVSKALAEVTEYCAFGFQGGEPTLAGLDFYRILMELEKKYNVNKVKTSHSIQTNGLLIDDEWAAFLADNHFLTGLSIDAGKQVHDGLRLDTQGKGTHTRCIHTARALRKYRAEFNILSVVTKQLALHPDQAYRFYKQNGFRYIQFIPCLDGFDQPSGSNLYSLPPELYGKFLCRVFDLWYQNFIEGDYCSIRAFDNYIHILAGYPPENCAMGGVCQPYPLIEADGSVYPCDFYAVDEYYLGSVHTQSFGDLLTGTEAIRFIQPSRQLHSSCTACRHHTICRGGCRRDREPAVGGQMGLNRFCEAYLTFFDHAIDRMREISYRMFPRSN